MFGLLYRLWRRDDGAIAVHFAVAVPIFILLISGIVELGNALHQSQQLQRGMKAAGLFAARAEWPLSADDTATITSLVKTGKVVGGNYLLSGWTKGESVLTISDATFSDAETGTDLPLVKIYASVPFEPLIPGLAALFGLDNINITASHEQPHIGK